MLKLNTTKETDAALTQYWNKASKVKADSEPEAIYAQLGVAENTLREVGAALMEAQRRQAHLPDLLDVAREIVAAWDAWRANPMEYDDSPEPDYVAKGRAILTQLGA
jgi:predicted RNA-binding Zn ribbon-like protein